MDEKFVSKVYRTIVYTWALALLWTIAYGKLWIALNISFGVLLGTAVLAIIAFAVRRTAVPGAKKPGRSLLKFMILKYILIIIALFFLTKWSKFSPIAFIGGILLTHFAILAKLAGIKIVERSKQSAANDSAS